MTITSVPVGDKIAVAEGVLVADRVLDRDGVLVAVGVFVGERVSVDERVSVSVGALDLIGNLVAAADSMGVTEIVALVPAHAVEIQSITVIRHNGIGNNFFIPLLLFMCYILVMVCEQKPISPTK